MIVKFIFFIFNLLRFKSKIIDNSIFDFLHELLSSFYLILWYFIFDFLLFYSNSTLMNSILLKNDCMHILMTHMLLLFLLLFHLSFSLLLFFLSYFLSLLEKSSFSIILRLTWRLNLLTFLFFFLLLNNFWFFLLFEFFFNLKFRFFFLDISFKWR